MADLPIVCTLTPEALTGRREGLLSELLRQAQCREMLSDGLRLTFHRTGETLSTVVRVVNAESDCCRFLRFAITVEPDGGPIVLQITGPPGTGEFIARLLDM